MNLVSYNRVSTDEQKVGLQMYEQSIKRFCEYHNHTLVGQFQDEDVSGGIAFAKRPSGRKCYDLLMEGKADGIIVGDVSRMFRNLEDGVVLERIFRENGIKMLFADGNGSPVDTTTETGFMMFLFPLIQAHLGRLNRKVTTKKNMEFRRNSGLVTSHTPYGYERATEGKDNRLYEKADEMKVVEMIFQMLGLNYSLTKIAAELNSHSIPSKTGKTWSRNSVDSVINYHTKRLGVTA